MQEKSACKAVVEFHLSVDIVNVFAYVYAEVKQARCFCEPSSFDVSLRRGARRQGGRSRGLRGGGNMLLYPTMFNNVV